MSTMVSKLQQRRSDIQEERTKADQRDTMANPIGFEMMRIRHHTDQERSDSNKDSIDTSSKHETSWPCFDLLQRIRHFTVWPISKDC